VKEFTRNWAAPVGVEDRTAARERETCGGELWLSDAGVQGLTGGTERPGGGNSNPAIRRRLTANFDAVSDMTQTDGEKRERAQKCTEFPTTGSAAP
jgi:hypothetical protein